MQVSNATAARHSLAARAVAFVLGVSALAAPARSAHAQRMGGAYGVAAGPRLRPREALVPEVRLLPNVRADHRFNPQIVRRIMQRNIAQLAHCTEQSYSSSPGTDFTGLIPLRFAITAEGSVAFVTPSPPPGWGPQGVTLGRCVSAAIRRWTFPAPRAGAPVIAQATLSLRRPL